MSWETAVVVGSLGISFFLLYLNSQISAGNKSFKMGIIFLSWIFLIMTVAHIGFIIDESAPTATENINVATNQWKAIMWASIGFFAYWFISMAGGWLNSWYNWRKGTRG